MLTKTGNLWDFKDGTRAITTNGFVKTNGECVMGRGCAYEAKTKFPGLAKALGKSLYTFGNHVVYFQEYRLLTFPVKHNWWEVADPELIKRSAGELSDWIVSGLHPEGNVYLPRPGCGNGKLAWEQVKPLLEFLPDSVVVVSHAN